MNNKARLYSAETVSGMSEPELRAKRIQAKQFMKAAARSYSDLGKEIRRRNRLEREKVA